MGLAVSRADVRGRGRAAALTPSPSRVAHGPIPACALVIVADLSTGSRACRRHPPATKSRPRRVLPPACERPLCVHQTAICPRWLQCSRPSGCLEGPRASAPQPPFPLRRRVRRLQPVPRRQWTLRCHSRSRGQESQFPAPSGKQPGAARRPEAVAPPCVPRSAVALVPRSSAKELARPSRPSPHALVTSAACPF